MGALLDVDVVPREDTASVSDPPDDGEEEVEFPDVAEFVD
jgi:hypothetical protein